MRQLYRDHPLLVLYMLLASAALSMWCLYLDPVINNDGVTYIHLTQMILDGQWSKAFDTYSWPYYAIFIASISKATTLSPESSAYLLNIILNASLSFAFVCIIAQLSNYNRRIIVISILVILLFPSISKFRSFVIRDIGYLSCYLWSLYFIFRFCKKKDKSSLAGWLTFSLLSSLFRVEGIAFTLITPYFLFLFTPTQTSYKKLISICLSLTLLIVSAVLIGWYINDKYKGLIELARASGADVNNAIDLFIMKTENDFQGEPLTTWNVTRHVSSNLLSVAYELVRRMAIFYFFFAIYAYWRKLVFKNDLSKKIWLVYVASNLCLLAAYSVYNNFLVSRYTMASALTLLILSPFVINKIINGFQTFNNIKKSAAVFAITVLSIVSIEGLDVRTKKNHIKQAGLWIKSEIGNELKIFSNEPLIIYYAGQGYNQRLNDAYTTVELETKITNNSIQNYDYVAISTKPMSNDENLVHQTLINQFGAPKKAIKGVDDRTVFIFKTH